MAKKYYIEDNQDIPAIVYSETLPIGYTLITDQELILTLTKKRYANAETGGKDFYNGFRSKLYLLYASGSITATEAFTVETYLSDLKDALISGNWMTAQYICAGKLASGIFTDTLKAEILQGITDYINNNY